MRLKLDQLVLDTNDVMGVMCRRWRGNTRVPLEAAGHGDKGHASDSEVCDRRAIATESGIEGSTRTKKSNVE